LGDVGNAGNADIAQMLRLIEDGIPLAWSRQQHHLFPQWCCPRFKFVMTCSQRLLLSQSVRT